MQPGNSESDAYEYGEPPGNSAYIYGALLEVNWWASLTADYGFSGDYVAVLDQLRKRTGIPSLQIAAFQGPKGQKLAALSIIDFNPAYPQQYRPLLTREQMNKYVEFTLDSQPRWWRYRSPGGETFEYDPREDSDNDEGQSRRRTLQGKDKGQSRKRTLQDKGKGQSRKRTPQDKKIEGLSKGMSLLGTMGKVQEDTTEVQETEVQNDTTEVEVATSEDASLKSEGGPAVTQS